jgi:SAM-dependent methyltransferase
VQFELGTSLVPEGFAFSPLQAKATPEVDFSGVSVPHHLTPELLSYFPRAKRAGSLALDLGCGSGLHRQVCEHAGYEWLGLDYGNPAAPLLGDGHALPLRDESVDFIMSMAVLEHIQHTPVVSHEIFRVLKPGGYFIGSVAFLEPFHSRSFYHHTHLGTYNTLRVGGLEVQRVAPNASWSSLRAQASMSGLFPHMPRPLSRAIVWPVEMLSRAWWRLGRLADSSASESRRLVATTGSYEFVARKPD